MHWASEYIGCKWQIGKSGSTSYDCYGLVQHVLLQHFYIKIPRRALIADASHFYKLKERENGAITLLMLGNNPVHIGIWLKDQELDGLLHATIIDGVIYSKLNNLLGWRIEGFYNYVNNG